MTTFAEFGLTAPVLRSLEDLGFEEPTPVQARALPILLAGRDMVAQALTGTGKTAAYGIPLIERIDVEADAIQAVILAPTRELAVQVAEHLSRLGHRGGLRLVPIYGGQPIGRQLRSLERGMHVVVATPGRLIDHINRGTIDLSHVKMLVLDEADQMLQMGFQEDVELIMAAMPAERTTALFSATMPKPILDIVGRYMRDPEMVHLSTQKALTVPTVSQVYHEVPFPRKADALRRILDAKQPDRTMVFCATKRTVDDVCEQLQGHGYQAEALHGDISQPAREKVLRGFKLGRSEVLVATDVAARGLDIPEVSLVINFDIPPDPEYYVHRIGRTARLGRAGEAVTFINPRELRELRVIERATGATIRRAELPTAADAATRELQTLDERLRQMLASDRWGRFRTVVAGLAEEFEPSEVAAAALALAASAKSASERSVSGAVADRADYARAPRRAEFDRAPRAKFERTPRPEFERTARPEFERAPRAEDDEAQDGERSPRPELEQPPRQADDEATRRTVRGQSPWREREHAPRPQREQSERDQRVERDQNPRDERAARPEFELSPGEEYERFPRERQAGDKPKPRQHRKGRAPVRPFNTSKRATPGREPARAFTPTPRRPTTSRPPQRKKFR